MDENDIYEIFAIYVSSVAGTTHRWSTWETE